MKRKITTLLTLVLMTGGALIGQNQQMLKELDTLQNGQFFLTLRLPDSTFIKRYMVFNPIDTSKSFQYINTSFPQSDSSNADYETTSIDLFGTNTSALPWDVAWNPNLDKYYIYNYRKVMVYNNTGFGFFEKPIIISEFDEIYSDMVEVNFGKRILYHNGYIYCTSNKGILMVIDCSINKVVNSFECPAWSSVYRSDLRLIGTNIYWYYSAIVNDNSDNNHNSYIRKINGTTLSDSLDLPEIIINDWCFGKNDSLYLATNEGLFRYTSDLICSDTNTNFKNIVKIEYFNNNNVQRLVAKNDDGINQLLSFSTTLDQPSFFYINSNDILNLKFNSYDKKIYYTGINNGHEGKYGKIIYNSSLNNFVEDISITLESVPLTIELNNMDAWVGCGDNIIKFNQNDSTTYYPIQGVCNRIVLENNQYFKLLGTLPLSGDIVCFDSTMNKTEIETGGIIKGVSQKIDKQYYIVSKGNGNGYIFCKKNNINFKIFPDTIEGDYFNPVAIFSFKEISQTDVFVAFEGRNLNNEKKLKFGKIDNNDNKFSILSELEFTYDFGIEKFIIKNYDQRMYFTYLKNGCSMLPLILFKFNISDTLSLNYTDIPNCSDIEYDSVSNLLYTLGKCNYKVFTYDGDDLGDMRSYNLSFIPYSLCFNYSGQYLLISGKDNNDNIKLFVCKPNNNQFIYYTYLFNTSGKIVTDLTLSTNDNVYGFSKNSCYKIDTTFNITEYLYPDNDTVFTYDVHYEPGNNIFYIHSFRNLQNEIVTFVFDANSNTFLQSVKPGLKYIENTSSYHDLSFYNADQAIILAGNSNYSNSLQITCPYTRPITTPWHWLSFPRLKREANNPVLAIPVLENLDPIPDNLYFHSNEEGYPQFISRKYGTWDEIYFNNIFSTKGYKLNILDVGSFTHTMYGTDLNPNTPIQLYAMQNNNPENWIGYFLHRPLMPEDAFQGVWEYLTEIKTQYWTMAKIIINGRPTWLRTSNVTPIKYGDALVVKVSEDCTLYWNQTCEPAGESLRVAPEYFDYIEYADYQPWFIQTDSLGDVKEIGLMAGDVCIGASTVKTGDTLVGVNAYTQAVPPGTPITIATWDGLKSTAAITGKYFVIRPETGRKEYRTVHTGEGQPFYYISFTGQQNELQQNREQTAFLSGISPNPCKETAFIRFNVLKEADVAIEISDINGRRISTVAKGVYPEGSFEVVWKTTDAYGKPVENGIYIVSLAVDDRFIENQKVVVIR